MATTTTGTGGCYCSYQARNWIVDEATVNWLERPLFGFRFSENEQVSCANGNRQKENEKKLLFIELVR